MSAASDLIANVLMNRDVILNMQARADIVKREAQRIADRDLQRSVNGVDGIHYHDSFVTLPPVRRGTTIVSVIGNTAPHATWIEHGTRPHLIEAVNAPVLAFFWDRKGDWFFGPRVNHPGTAAYLILARALSVSQQQFGS